MEKTKKRNELSIFEELRLKPPTNARTKEHYPREYSLHKLNVLCKVDKKNNPLSWWKKRPNGKLMQVNEFGEMIFSSDERYEKIIPQEKSLKKNQSKILVTLNKYKIPVNYEIKGNFLNYIKFKRAVSKSKKMLNFEEEGISLQKDLNNTIVAKGSLTIVGLPDEFF